ncbi:hypothetical protein G7078_02535 [Sphingomonas sinipercae]|uniref:Transporter n=1 Tax=Sphingomonas sinipercae TaxID=2714944 RepID=A0A6G7ZLH0_9SPHN|nr:hypothetical protein [Sphingomonas sinipercae]QIL01772.1 hypothetical protein G7078_02535 [Sphingomonas sinipercae]
MKVAILTPAADYAGEWRWAYDLEAKALTDAGMAVEPIAWTDQRDLRGFDLVLPLVAWGYHQDYERWLGFLDRAERDGLKIENPVALLRWNGDKAYLTELGGQGIPTVPTIMVDALDEAGLDRAREALGSGELVVKPPISASSYGTFRIGHGEGVPEPVRGWRMLVQPWLGSIVSAGEYSLIFFGGAFSHCVSKVPVPGEFRVQPEFGGVVTRCDPPAGARDVATAALAAAPTAATYARVDLVVGNDGALQVIELELIEPAFFLAQVPEAGPRFAAAVRSAAERLRE